MLSYLLKIENWLPLFVICLFFSIQGISAVYYAGLVGVIIIFFQYFRKGCFHRGISLFVFICLLSLCLSRAALGLSPYLRFIVYLFILLICSPWFENQYLKNLRKHFFYFLMQGCIYVTCISFLLMVAGIIPLRNPSETAGGFAGLATSSMTMAPIAVLSVLYGIYHILSVSYVVKKVVYSIVVFIGLYVILICGSRSALGGGIAALCVFFFSYYRGRLRYFFLYFFLVFVLMIATYSYWESSLIVFTQKLASEETMIEGENSRTQKWKNRIEEFCENPVIGVGAFSVDPRISKNDISSSGSIEYGSSWLALLSTTGILGFLTVFFILAKGLYRFFNSSVEPLQKALFCATGSFFCLHFLFEGYLWGVGNVLTLIFWLSFSVIISGKSAYSGNSKN